MNEIRGKLYTIQPLLLMHHGVGDNFSLTVFELKLKSSTYRGVKTEGGGPFLTQQLDGREININGSEN